MKSYRKTKRAADKATAKSMAKAKKQLKKDIARNRSRAKWVGILYLLGIIGMAALFFVGLLNGLGFAGLADGFKGLSDNLTAFVVSVLYTLVALVVVVNVFKALSKLGWLHKKKATMEYGFNRNAYAMNDLAGLFMGTATFIVVNYLFIKVLNGGAACLLSVWKDADLMMLLLIAVAIVIGVLADALGGKVRYYDIEDGGISVEPYMVGRFAGFIRKLIRIGAAFGILLALDFEVLHNQVAPLLNGGSFDTSNLSAIISLAIFVCLLPLIKWAFRANDYSLDNVGGDKGYAFFAFLILAASIARGVIGGEWIGTATGSGVIVIIANYSTIIMAALAGIAFLFELILRRRFILAEESAAKKQAKKDKKAEKKAAKKQAKKDAKQEKKVGSDAPNWDEGEFTYETLMRRGNITLVNGTPLKK